MNELELDTYLNKVFEQAIKIMPDLEQDLMSGVWMMVLDSEKMLFCTPFYEGVDGIAIALTNIDGDTIDTDDLPYQLTHNPEIDALEYVKQIKMFLDRRI